jgi:N-acetylglucosaminyl-diphospho-decaprenol L-rhamnosyltransferase
MHVAVAIVGFRNAQDIVRCIAALEASTYRDFEIVICENGGSEAHAELVAAVGGATTAGRKIEILLAPRNLGYAGGVNACLAASGDADLWWILNPDTEPHPAAMAALADRVTAGDCEAAGGVIVSPEGLVESCGGQWYAALAYPRSLGHGIDAGAVIKAQRIERHLSYISGASMMVGRPFLETVGLMREDYFLYCEEVEWCLRAISRGMRLGFAPSARVLHQQGTSTGSVRSLRDRPKLPVYLDTRNKILVTRDRFPWLAPLAVPGVLALMVIRCARAGAGRQLQYALQGLAAGILNERGAPAWLST